MVVNCLPAIMWMSSKPIEEANYDTTRSVMVVSVPAITHKHPPCHSASEAAYAASSITIAALSQTLAYKFPT